MGMQRRSIGGIDKLYRRKLEKDWLEEWCLLILANILCRDSMPVTDMATVKELSKQLRNVGPKLAAKMIEAGIDTPDKLRSMGARKAFSIMYKNGDDYGDFNAAYLYALEGAIRDCDWSDIPIAVKEEYKSYAQKLQREQQ